MKASKENAETRPEHTLIRKICEELGIDAAAEFRRLKASVFCEFIVGDHPDHALIDADVIRMWLASLVSREQVRPDMRATFDEIRQLGTYELREAWEVSELPMAKFNELLVSRNISAEPLAQGRMLH